MQAPNSRMDLSFKNPLWRKS